MQKIKFWLSITALAGISVGAIAFLPLNEALSQREFPDVTAQTLIPKAPPVTVVFERTDRRGRVHIDIEAYDQNGNFSRESRDQPLPGAEPLMSRYVDHVETGAQYIYSERQRNRGTLPLRETRKQQLMSRYLGEDADADCRPALTGDSISFVAEPAVNRIHGYRVVKVRHIGEAKANPKIDQPAATFGHDRWLAPALGCAVLQTRSWWIDEVSDEASASTMTATSVALAVDPEMFRLPERRFDQDETAGDSFGD